VLLAKIDAMRSTGSRRAHYKENRPKHRKSRNVTFRGAPCGADHAGARRRLSHNDCCRMRAGDG
jgi:hypothetical protein